MIELPLASAAKAIFRPRMRLVLGVARRFVARYARRRCWLRSQRADPAQGRFARWSKKLLTIEAKRGASVAVPSARFTRHSELYPQMIPPRGTKNESASGESVSWQNHGRAADFSPASADGALDEHHLREMTLGDQNLEREVLQVFARQISLMLNRIARAEPAHAAAAAHTLKGSALGLGAWRVAQAAERVEQAATRPG